MHSIHRTFLVAGLGLSLLLSCNQDKPAEAPAKVPVAEQKTAPKPVDAKQAKAAEAKKAPAAPASAAAEPQSFTGHVKQFTKKAKTLKVAHGGKSLMIKWDANTKLVDAEKFTQLKPPTKVTIKYVPGKPALEIKRMLVNIPPEMLITTDEVAKLVDQNKTKYTLVDARPTKRYLEGHIPTSINIFANEFDKNIDKLPKDRGQLVIFYCGGVTCGLSPKSAKAAKAKGYTNVKAYRDGMPGWKKSGRPMVLEPALAKAKLGPNAVFLDVRDAKAIAAGHIEGAVQFGEAEFLKRFAEVASNKFKRLENVGDQKAPIYIVGADANDAKAVDMWRKLKKWGYKQHAVLDGGYAAWAKAGLPTAKGPAATAITYVKKKVPGALTLAEAKAAVAAGAQLVDVRGADEAGDLIPGALNLPLDTLDANLAKLPKGKPVVFYCGTGIRASLAYETVAKKGFAKAKFLDDLYGGLKGAKSAAPTAEPEGEEEEGC